MVGVDVGVGLHSRRSAMKIVEVIANQIKTTVFSRIIAINQKVCLIIDEATTLSMKAVLIVFVRVEDPECPAPVFVELLELQKQDAETIYSASLGSLHKLGFTTKYLQKNLIAFCSDGANIMLERKSGVSARIAQDFPNIVIWYCLSHRLQLVLDDAIREVKQINHFKIFLDKILTTFQKFCKSQNDLFQISEQLGIEIVKIGRVLGPRWAACSLRATIAVWRAYPALHQFFQGNGRFPGMASRFENLNFLKDLALMIDILNEISLSSNVLQGREINIIMAEKLVLQTINAFEVLRQRKDRYETELVEVLKTQAFKNINLAPNQRFVALPHDKFLSSIITNLKKRLMDCDHLRTSSLLPDVNKLHFITYLEPDY
ncbi:E3 SUMO-protein ligase KIAA1586-like [Thamnophis elegans]|uniref:E3 SUMO-protein ligase KIAA1586-like n=1 Tax=Thamnophis elegans TaxID=35005 RepID=UPI001378AA16|nr:E3 SUMO-protein ligase KIAA1586-like [Thamnophis elegans]